MADTDIIDLSDLDDDAIDEKIDGPNNKIDNTETVEGNEAADEEAEEIVVETDEEEAEADLEVDVEAKEEVESDADAETELVEETEVESETEVGIENEADQETAVEETAEADQEVAVEETAEAERETAVEETAEVELVSGAEAELDTTDNDSVEDEAKPRKKKADDPTRIVAAKLDAFLDGDFDAKPKRSVSHEEKRIRRRKKRKRSRALAFICLFLVLALVGTGIYFGVNWAIQEFSKEPEPVVEVTPEVTEAVEEETNIVVDMTPDISEESQEEEVIEEPVEEVVEEQSPEELFEDMITSMIEQMTLEEKVAGLFMLSPEGLTGQNGVTKAGEGTQKALENYPIGGIVYAKQNIKNAEQLTEMITNTLSFSRYPMFIAIAEGGGSNSVMGALKVESTKTAKEIGDGNDLNAAHDTYKTIGSYLKEYGFNLELELSADILSNGNSTSFGSEGEIVASMVSSSITGIADAGINSCTKLFPGVGGVNGDSHKTITSTSRTKDEMEQSDLMPFRAAIAAGTDMIMVGHFSATELSEENLPCSLSKDIMTGLLRGEMGYDGVIITDAMNVPSISSYYGADEAAIKALKAGADMILMPEDFELAFNGVVEAVKDGTIDERRINDSLARVYRVKYKDTLQE